MVTNTSDRPNILLITSDQQRADCFGFAGRPVKTPHLDQLARDGTHFSNCITPNNVCMPARSSILTGLLPLTHGTHDNGIDLDPDIGGRGFAGTLAAAGYDTGFIGKAHFSVGHTNEPTGTPECVESSASYPEDWSGPYMGFEHVELMMLGHNWFEIVKPPKGHHFERWYHRDGRGDEKTAAYWGDYKETGGLAAQTWNSKLPTAWHNSTWVGDRTVDYIRSHQNGPWCLWASIPDPHHPFDAPEPWCYLHDPDEVDLPEHRTRDLDRRPWWHREVLERKVEGKFGEVRMAYSRIPEQNDEGLRRIIANTFGQISLIDHTVGRMLIALEETGLAENTIVIFTTDHGDWLGDHGLVLKGPMNYDGLLKVGLIMRGPTIPANERVDEPVSTLDLAATLNDWTGASALGPSHSQSLVPLVEDRNASREYAYNEWKLGAGRAGVALDLQCVRTKTHKLTLENSSGEGELYDLANDPHEMDNRWNDPGLKAIQSELRDMIRARPQDQMDPLPPRSGAA